MRRIVDTIVRELSDGMREQIRTAIMAGDDRATFEKEYGDCVIVVDVRAYGSQITLAVVSHYDAKHKSPRLEHVIEDAMPNWYSVEREVANILCRSYHTVRTQKKAIYAKLGVSKDTELLAYMICERKGIDFSLQELREQGIEYLTK